MKPIIEVKNISKKYNINHQRGGYITLRDTLTNVFKNPFAFLKNKTKQIFNKEEFWALKDVNFEIMPGEVVGIIGRNGAGKSTLLKILSQITPPTTGEIKINGTVGSLLEVGTGFHPELTGRENIFLNGAILGMKHKDIVSKFNDIVQFAEIEKFLDTPVKYYSSGMYVKLAFSVSAHMSTDILIVDEVLAVGDSDFQKKCLGKMEEITKDQGRTILFVSHNMVTVKQLCKKCILFSKGELKMVGDTDNVIDAYLHAKPEKSTTQSIQNLQTHMVGTGSTRFTEASISNTEGNTVIGSHDRLRVVLKYNSDTSDTISNPTIIVTVRNKLSKKIVLRLDSDVVTNSISEKLQPEGEIVCETDESISLMEGTYTADIDFIIDGISISHTSSAVTFDVETDLEEYKYKRYPDKTLLDTVIKYSFRESK